MADADPDSLAHARPEIGFSTRYAQLLVVGAVFVALGGFLTNLVAVSDHPSESMAHLAQWSLWLGSVTVSASLLLAGVTGHGTTPGVRTALVLGGAYLLLTTSVRGLGFLAGMLF